MVDPKPVQEAITIHALNSQATPVGLDSDSAKVSPGWVHGKVEVWLSRAACSAWGYSFEDNVLLKI